MIGYGMSAPTRDHLTPRALDKDSREILIVCRKCNCDKGCLTIGQWVLKLYRSKDHRHGRVLWLIRTNEKVQRAVRRAAEMGGQNG